jgi:hypothetical protein
MAAQELEQQQTQHNGQHEQQRWAEFRQCGSRQRVAGPDVSQCLPLFVELIQSIRRSHCGVISVPPETVVTWMAGN